MCKYIVFYFAFFSTFPQIASHLDDESDVEEETILIQISQLLNTIALHHRNTDEVSEEDVKQGGLFN